MGAYDDLIPGSTASTGGYADLVPKPKTEEEERRERLRKMALAAMKQSSGEPGAGDLFGNAFTLGLQKPTAGVVGVADAGVKEIGSWFSGKPHDFLQDAGEQYSAQTGAYQDYMNEARKNSGWGGTAAELGGSVFSGGPARNFVQQAYSSLPKVIGESALLGGIEGAAENSEDLSSAVKGGATGAAVSGATTGILGGLIDYGKSLLPGARAQRGIEREIARGPDPNAIRQQSKDLFGVLDRGGIAYDMAQSGQLADDIMTELVQGGGGWDPLGAHSVLRGVVDRIEGMRGQPLSLDTLQQIRSQAGANARDPHPSVREAAGRILRSIDGYVQNVLPAQSALPAGQDVGPLWTEARRLWKTANTIDDINWRVDKAERRAASTNSGQNEENAIRQNIRGVVDKSTQPGRFNPYRPDELAQMNRIVEGTGAQNAWRAAGNFTSGIPAGTITGGAGAALAGLGLGGQLDTATALLAPAAGLGVAGATQFAGRAMKNKATNIAQDEADALVRLMSTGSLNRLPVPQWNGPPSRATLARMMAPQRITSGLGRFGKS